MKKLILLTTLIYTGLVSQAWNIFNTSNSGIPSNNIVKIVADKQGNKWIATDDGVVKYDGTSWIVYRPNNGVFSNVITALAIEDNGILWASSQAGIQRFDGNTWTRFYSVNSPLPFSDWNGIGIAIDKTNKKYFYKYDYPGLVVYNDTSWTLYNKNNSGLTSSALGVFNIAIDSNDKKWISSYPGNDSVCVFDNLNWVTYSGQHFGGYLFFVDSLNRKWFSTSRHGIKILDDTTWLDSGIPYIIGGDTIIATNINFENNGKIWINIYKNSDIYNATWVTFENNQLTYYNDPSIKNFTNSQSLLIDNNNIKWFYGFSYNQSPGIIIYKCSFSNPSLTDTINVCNKDSFLLANTKNQLVGMWYDLTKQQVYNNVNTISTKDTGSYHLYFKDANGCSSKESVIYKLKSEFNIGIYVSDTIKCLLGNKFKFWSTATGDSINPKYKWNIRGLTVPEIENSFDSAGFYKIELIAQSNGGCMDTSNIIVRVLQSPTAGPMLGATTALSVATPYVYTVAQQPNHTYNWVVSNGIIAYGQGTNAVTVQWLSNGKGNLKVEVTNAQGCNDTTATQVTIGNVGLHEAGNINSLMVYPNPSNGTFAVSFNALKSSTVEMSLVNLLGQQIWSENRKIDQGENEIKINTELLPGIYSLRMTSISGEIINKILIQ
jgi:hypothetical protein